MKINSYLGPSQETTKNSRLPGERIASLTLPLHRYLRQNACRNSRYLGN